MIEAAKCKYIDMSVNLTAVLLKKIKKNRRTDLQRTTHTHTRTENTSVFIFQCEKQVDTLIPCPASHREHTHTRTTTNTLRFDGVLASWLSEGALEERLVLF